MSQNTKDSDIDNLFIDKKGGAIDPKDANAKVNKQFDIEEDDDMHKLYGGTDKTPVSQIIVMYQDGSYKSIKGNNWNQAQIKQFLGGALGMNNIKGGVIDKEECESPLSQYSSDGNGSEYGLFMQNKIFGGGLSDSGDEQDNGDMSKEEDGIFGGQLDRQSFFDNESVADLGEGELQREMLKRMQKQQGGKRVDDDYDEQDIGENEFEEQEFVGGQFFQFYDDDKACLPKRGGNRQDVLDADAMLENIKKDLDECGKQKGGNRKGGGENMEDDQLFI